MKLINIINYIFFLFSLNDLNIDGIVIKTVIANGCSKIV